MRFTLLLIALACCSCGNERYGYWKGTHIGDQAGNAFEFEFTLHISEDSDGNVVGGWVSKDEDGSPFATGTFDADGDINSAKVSVTFNHRGTRCEGTYEVDLNFDGDTITADFDGTNVDKGGAAQLPFSIPCGAITSKLELTKDEG